MKLIKTAAAVFFLGAVLAPVAGYSDDMDKKPTTKESVGETIDDAAITTKVKANFIKDKAVDAGDIKVRTTKGVVMLTGTAKSQAEKDKAVSIAKGVKGVVSVKNDLTVASK